MESLGFFQNPRQNSKEYIHQYIKLRLEALGLVDEESGSDSQEGFLHLAKSLIINYRERERQFKNYLCPADQRIQNFINNYFSGVDVHDISIPPLLLLLTSTELQESYLFRNKKRITLRNIFTPIELNRESFTIQRTTAGQPKGSFILPKAGSQSLTIKRLFLSKQLQSY